MSSPALGHAFAKGAVLYGLDQISTHEDARTLLKGLYDAIKAKAYLGFKELDVTFDEYLFTPLKMEAATAAAVSSYLKRCWFDADLKDAYFWEFQPIAPIFAVGIMRAIDKSLNGRERPLPINSWWIMDHPRVEALTLISPHQVTFLFATPRPHQKPPAPQWGPPTRAWTSGRLGVVDLDYKRS